MTDLFLWVMFIAIAIVIFMSVLVIAVFVLMNEVRRLEQELEDNLPPF